MNTCPKCHSEKIHRSRARNSWETWRKRLTSRRPFRCDSCGWRGWTAPDAIGTRDATQADIAGRKKELTLDDFDRLDPAPTKARKPNDFRFTS